MREGTLGRLFGDVRELLTEQIEYRELLLQMTLRDLILRYKQTDMGFGWAVFMPLINTAIFSIIFMRVARLDTGIPYPLFAFSGLLAWNFFASALRFSVTSLTSNSNLVTKVYFPREIFPFSALIVCCVDLLVGSTVLIALMIYYGTHLTPAVLFLPVVFAVHSMFTAGMALLLAMANLFYRDVKYLFEVVLNVWMFATSVVYPVSLIGGRLCLVLRANPMTPIIDGYRSILFQGELPTAGPFLAAAILSAAVLAVCWVVFHRAEFTFAENI
jgi:ABC-type polysaccharide/polyol phosphate export permease